MATSELSSRRGSPDTGEQKLSVPVATAPAAAKFRGGGRRAAESPPPPLPPARSRGPPFVPVCSASLSLGVCGRPPEGSSLRSGRAAPGSPVPSVPPPSSRGWLEGGRAPHRVSELLERGPRAPCPQLGARAGDPEAPWRALVRLRMSDGRANWSCQVDKRDGCARRRRTPSPASRPSPAQGRDSRLSTQGPSSQLVPSRQESI